MAEEKKLEGPIYGVPWIEVEYGWGERPEGYLLFTDLEQRIEAKIEAGLDFETLYGLDQVL